MGNLGLNKIAGAVLATSLGLIGLHNVSNIVFAEGGDSHHGDEHHDQTMSEQMCGKFAYCVDVADGGHGAETVEDVFDLGLLLASADASKGARVFKGKCSTCHTIDAGGANGTGPNLNSIVGTGKAAKAGFGYSSALTGVGGDWTYEDLDGWLKNPASFARGTSMSFAGVQRDPERMNLIAYLAENTSGAPAYPAPLPAVAEDTEAHSAGHGEDAVHAEPVDTAVPANTTEETGSIIEAIVDEAHDAIEEIVTEEVPVEAPADAEHH